MTTNGTQVSLASKGAPGAAGTPGLGAQALWLPQDLGLVAWAFDPELAGTNVGPWGAGIIFLMRVKMGVSAPISKVGLPLRTTAASGLTNTFVGVYTQSGVTATILAQSADISSTVNGASVPTFYNLTAPTATQAAGTQLLVAFLAGAATTGPTLLGVTSSSNRFIAAKQNFRSLVFGTGQTALPSTMDLSSASAGDGGARPSFVLA